MIAPLLQGDSPCLHPEAESHCPMPQAPLPTVTMIETVFPNQTNHDGTLFSGRALRLTDNAVSVAVSRHARKTVRTACPERFDFQAVVPHGRRIELSARVVVPGRTAMTASVDPAAEALLSGGRRLCAQDRLLLVALDESQRRKAVPRVAASPETVREARGK